MWKEFLYCYYVIKSAYRWYYQYHLPTLSCQRSLWMTPKVSHDSIFGIMYKHGFLGPIHYFVYVLYYSANNNTQSITLNDRMKLYLVSTISSACVHSYVLNFVPKYLIFTTKRVTWLKNQLEKHNNISHLLESRFALKNADSI